MKTACLLSSNHARWAHPSCRMEERKKTWKWKNLSGIDAAKKIVFCKSQIQRGDERNSSLFFQCGGQYFNRYRLTAAVSSSPHFISSQCLAIFTVLSELTWAPHSCVSAWQNERSVYCSLPFPIGSLPPFPVLQLERKFFSDSEAKLSVYRADCTLLSPRRCSLFFQQAE